MRLRTLPVSVAGVFAACAFNLSHGNFKVAPAVLCLLFAVLCQVVSNFANEYYDFKAGRDSVGREGPRRGVTEGDITPEAMKRAIYGTLAAAAMTGLSLTYWGGLWLIVPGILIGLGALAYSTGPYPLSTHCLGEVAVLFFFGIIPVNLTYYVQALEWSQPVLLTSIAMGLLGANVLVVNNTRDIPDDKAVGKHTLATVFGQKAMVGLYLLNICAAMALTLNIWLGSAWIVVPVLYVLLGGRIVQLIRKFSGSQFNPFLGITSVTMLLFSFVLIIRLM